jgi:catechol 2,3-dioxygenase-like lactoylglutathione lyase family enzyme
MPSGHAEASAEEEPTQAFEPLEPEPPSDVDRASSVGPSPTKRPASSSPWVAEPFSVPDPESATEPTQPIRPIPGAEERTPGTAAAVPASTLAEAPTGTRAEAPTNTAAEGSTDAQAGAAAGAPATTASGASGAQADTQELRPEGSPWGDLTHGTAPDEHADDLITAYPSARPGPAGAIHGVGITILVADLDRSVAFYRDMLGFFVIDSGGGSAVLASGDTRLVLRTVDGLSAEAGRLIYLNLEVGDVDAVYEELRSKGVRFVHEPRAVNRGERLELWSATFEDPDGHNVAITQWRATR